MESRRLLAAGDEFSLLGWTQDEFTVRRDESAPVTINLWNHYRDQAVAVDIIDSGSGQVTLPDDGIGSILYQPEPEFVGVDLITVNVTARKLESADGSQAPETYVRQLAINVVEPLLAVDDWYSVQVGQDEPLALDVLSNDIQNARYLGQQPELTIDSIRTETDVAVSISDDGKYLIYTPTDGFTGLQSIQYTAVDRDGYTATGTAQIRVQEEPSDTLWPDQIQQQLVQRAAERYQYSFGTGESQSAYYDNYAYRAFADDSLDFASLNLPPRQETSGTNNQIADVDESDRIKTDGRFLYVLTTPAQNGWMGWDIFPWIGLPRFANGIGQSQDSNASENMLTVIDIQSPENPVIVSREIFADKVLSLDLHGDRLSVIGQRNDQTVVSTFDISDASNITTVSTTLVDGNFKLARRVADSLYVFTDQYGSSIPELQAIASSDETYSFYETGSEYLDRVRDSLLDVATPSQQVFDGDGNPVGDRVASVDLLATGILNHHFLNILTFDTASDTGGAIDWDINDGGATVLVTPESIYVTHTDYETYWPVEPFIDVIDFIVEPPSVTTTIDRYELQDDGSVSPVASGSVPGTLKNSFSLSEFDGNLRIATEDSWSFGPAGAAGSSVYVLQQSADQLDIIGATDQLAPGEQIYAVRFAGPRGYVVTFRQVDPLFVLDLSDPTDPQVKGELKVPGYSQYLHVVSDTLVLGVGRDADPNTGQYQGLTVSMFDVTEPENPTLQDRYLFEGGRSTFSPFAGGSAFDIQDHHAISFFANESILALPYYSQAYFAGEFSDDDPNKPIFNSSEQSAVATFHIDTEDGIMPLDNIPFDSRADRALRVGDYLYSLSPNQLQVTHLTEPDGVVASLDFERQGADDFIETSVGEKVIVDVTENDKIGIDSIIEILAASLLDGVGEVSVVDGRRLQFQSVRGRLSPSRVQYTARDEAGTLINAITTIDPDLVWQNARDRFDINDDGKRSPRDILNVINTISDHGATDTESIEAAIENTASDAHFYSDTNGDKYVTPDDILQVIDRIAESMANRNANATTFELDRPLNVRVNQLADNEANGWQLSIIDVLEDSRCATDATCVWEGQVRVELETHFDGEAKVSVLTYQTGQSNFVTVGDYQISIENVSPESVLNEPIEATDYRFLLVVSQLDA